MNSRVFKSDLNFFKRLGTYSLFIFTIHMCSAKGATGVSDKGITVYIQGLYPAAFEYFNKAIQLDTNDAYACYVGGWAFQNQTNYDNTIADLGETILLKPGTDGFIVRGNLYSQKQDYKRAIADYSEAIRLNPWYAEVYPSRADLYIKKGEFDKAIADCDKAIEMNPKLASAYSCRANAYSYKGDYDRAITDCSKAIKLDPHDEYAFFIRGATYCAQKDYDRAIDDFTRAIQLNPGDAYLLSFRGSIHFAQTNYDLAIADYNEVIQLNPKFIGQYSYRGDAYAQNGDYDAAIADYTEVINNNSDKAIKAMTYGKRGFIYSRKGDYRMGIADCNKALKIDANCGLAYNNLAWLLAVSPDAALRNGRKASEYARKACVLSAWKEPHCLGTLAAAYAETGNFEKAVKCQERCMTLELPAGEKEQAQKDLGLYEQDKPYHEDGQK